MSKCCAAIASKRARTSGRFAISATRIATTDAACKSSVGRVTFSAGISASAGLTFSKAFLDLAETIAASYFSMMQIDWPFFA